jgi:hypothetical protein
VKGKIEKFGDKELAGAAQQGGIPYPRSGNRKGMVAKTLRMAAGGEKNKLG